MANGNKWAWVSRARLDRAYGGANCMSPLRGRKTLYLAVTALQRSNIPNRIGTLRA